MACGGGADARLAGQHAAGQGTPVRECKQDLAPAAVSQHGADHRQIRIPAASRHTRIRVIAQRHLPTLTLVASIHVETSAVAHCRIGPPLPEPQRDVL
jgi:hypothetical protein